MKKKHINILLIVLVLGVWGKLIYNYTQRFTKSTTITNQNYTNLNDLIKVEKKAFALNILDRDPFLNKMFIKKRIAKKIKRLINKAPISKNTRWPKIIYLGFIKNKNASNKLAILKVNGSIKNVKELSYFNENIYIRKIYKDSITLQLNNQTKTIKK